MAIQPKTRILADEYYRLPEYQQQDNIQLIHGEVIIEMPPIPRHQQIVGEILYLLMTFVRKIGGRAFTSPIEVYLDEQNVFEPDVLYLRPDSTCEVGDKRLTGAPELIVEVLSPSTAKFDRQEKYQAYEKHHVQEYWIVDPIHDVLEVWNHDGNQFVRQGAYGVDDTLQSKVLSQAIQIRDIFPTDES